MKEETPFNSTVFVGGTKYHFWFQEDLNAWKTFCKNNGTYACWFIGHI